MAPRFALITHADHEGPGHIAAWLTARGAALSEHRFADGAALPPLATLAGLVVLGGPMGVYERERHPWLDDERAAVGAALAARLPVLGICLGAQLIAAALGARVAPGPRKEIGWYEVTRAAEATASPFAAAAPARITTFHWHGDGFALPPGAVRLFSSAACREQGFAIGTQVLALQFHPEVDAAMVARWARVGADELDGAPGVQSPAALLAGVGAAADGHALLDALLPLLFGAALGVGQGARDDVPESRRRGDAHG